MLNCWTSCKQVSRSSIAESYRTTLGAKCVCSSSDRFRSLILVLGALCTGSLVSRFTREESIKKCNCYNTLQVEVLSANSFHNNKRGCCFRSFSVRTTFLTIILHLGVYLRKVALLKMQSKKVEIKINVYG